MRVARKLREQQEETVKGKHFDKRKCFWMGECGVGARRSSPNDKNLEFYEPIYLRLYGVVGVEW